MAAVALQRPPYLSLYIRLDYAFMSVISLVVNTLNFHYLQLNPLLCKTCTDCIREDHSCAVKPFASFVAVLISLARSRHIEGIQLPENIIEAGLYFLVATSEQSE